MISNLIDQGLLYFGIILGMIVLTVLVGFLVWMVMRS